MSDGEIIPRRFTVPEAIEVSGPSSMAAWSLPAREPHLRDYWRTVRKHQWLILTFLVTIVTVVTIATFKMKPIYEATARIEVDHETPNVLPFQNAPQYDVYEDLENYIETQDRVLQSETLALETIRNSGIAANAEFGGHSGQQVSVPSLDPDQPPMERPAILGQFLSALRVKRVPNSRLVDVTFESTDPRLAARVLNDHLHNYIEANFRSRYDQTTQASVWLQKQLDTYKIQVEKSEDARLQYERDNQIWEIDEKQNITTQKLADLNQELTQAQADRMKKEADFKLAQGGNVDAIPAVRDSGIVQQFTAKQAELRQQYEEALAQTGPNMPRVQRLNDQLKSLNDLVGNEKKNIVNRIEQEYRTAMQREQLLTQALDRQKTEANDMGEKLVQYNILKKDAEANKQLYDGLLQKLKEASIVAGLRSSNVRIVDPALVPSYPVRPRRGFNVLLALAVGLIGGLGLAFLREYMDNTIKTPDDIELLTRLPSLAVIPAFSPADARRNRLGKMLKGSTMEAANLPLELVSHSMPQSQMSEAFRSLRTSILLSRAERPPQVILVTSALPREGKTTAAVNLAVTLAQLGDKTLLIDADLRKPGISRTLGLADSNYSGLSSHLAGVSSLEMVTVPHPTISNLAVVPTGPVPPNPADLLSSDRLKQAISQLRGGYKFIVIDSPPIMAATDAVIMSVLADGVLIVVRSGETPKEAFTRMRDMLAGVNSHLLGVLLNGVDANSPDYYYSYRYYPYADSSQEIESEAGASFKS
jgi:polysaccharide biosynthesis transport protein